ncbi:MAG: DNA mismatch repair protein MutS [Thermomicrobiales bacterium]|nr:DNA mismatch repair protein MutS [Thermomicrobiales bacterium]
MNAEAQRNPLPARNGHAREPDDGAVTVAPVRRQYLQIKRRFPDTILLFRLGDFYETFEQDAEIAAGILDIVLTGRDLGKGHRVPMAGIPHHAAESYIARLVAAGHKVAVCEQIGSAAKSRGLIERDVTRVVTPGTVTEPGMLDSRRNTYIAAILLDGARCGIAYADCSTGEFAATQLSAKSGDDLHQAVEREIARIGVAEILVPDGQGAGDDGARWPPDGIAISQSDRWHWRFAHAEETLRRHFAVEALDGFGLADKPAAIQAAGALLAYLADTQRTSLSQIASLRTYGPDGYMLLDPQARRNLELEESARGEKRHGLVAVLDATHTPMGARLLRQWLGQPLLNLAAIRQRQDAIHHFVDDALGRASLREALGRVGDIERLANRAATGAISPRELGQLRQSLALIPDLAAAASAVAGCPPLDTAAQCCGDIHGLLCRALPGDIPPSIGSGGVIRPGFAPDLDAHERAVREAREWIAGLERRERERTGIRSLKVGFNRVSGYFIEISVAALAAAEKERAASPDGSPLPAEYVMRQGLANSARYVTTELKDHEARILGAQETLAQLEEDVYRRIVAEVGAHARALREAATAIAWLDVASALAEVAANRGYVRPTVDDSLAIEIAGGRHPTLESLLPHGEFVPNDARLDGGERRITILTGPNMAGKSSWLRQTALIVLLAQIGSFVPATSARIGLVDRIFTRIGAQDDITAGQSTFMVEMLETANILHHATPRSLVLLDEIGRGTSTWDGLAIARGVVEHLHNAPHLGSRTLFATHFHELTELAEILPGVCCARMDVLEEGDRVVFLHRVVDGAADRSYGIHVAELAGIPRALTRRAREILTELERGPVAEVMRGRRRAMAKAAPEAPSALQLTLFAPPSPVETALAEIDVESLTPLEALTKLYELKRLVAEQSSGES